MSTMEPPEIRPMLAGTFNEHKISEGLWTIEPKIDGIRVLVTINPGLNLITYQTRNGNPIPSLCLSHRLNAEILLNIVPKLDGKTIILDAEAVADRDFYKSAGKLRRKVNIEDVARLVVFDVPFWGDDLRPDSYCERRATLEHLFSLAGLHTDDQSPPQDQAIRLVPVLDTDDDEGIRNRADSILDDALQAGFEGVIFKHIEGHYSSGLRSSSWLKLKPIKTYDCTICGYTPGRGELEGSAGALLVRTPWDVLVRVSSGISLDMRKDIYDHPQKFVGKKAELECQELTPSGSMRHPRLVCIREDI
jgi:ATP-dependent DNA ligase